MSQSWGGGQSTAWSPLTAGLCFPNLAAPLAWASVGHRGGNIQQAQGSVLRDQIQRREKTKILQDADQRMM